MVNRKRRTCILLIVFSIGILLTGCATSENQPVNPDFSDMEKGTVKRVVDGDTFVLSTGERVRMIGVDAPESVKPNSPVEYYGEEASAFTKEMLTGKTIYMAKDVSDKDQYDRLLRYVYLEDGTFFNLLLIQEGYANMVTFPPDVKYADLFRDAEKSAREKKTGLWERSS